VVDINQVRADVNGACSRYEQELQQIRQLENAWNTAGDDSRRQVLKNELYAVRQRHEACQNYLEQMKKQMIKAEDYFQNKIMEYEQSNRVFGELSKFQFGGSAVTAAKNLSKTQAELQENLQVTQTVIEKIDSTLRIG
jgi:hypothetical protein